MKIVLASLCLFSFALMASCGGGSGGGTCANAPACGGNIVGTWKITSSCISVDVSQVNLMTDCPGETAAASGFAITGDVTYATDMTYTASSTLTGNVIVKLPASCLMSQGVTVTCAQLTDALQPDLAAQGFQSAVCAAAGGGCSCTLVATPMTSMEHGAYSTTAAGILTQQASDATSPEQDDYCVSGTKLTLSPHAGSSMMGQGTASGTITLTKQ